MAAALVLGGLAVPQDTTGVAQAARPSGGIVWRPCPVDRSAQCGTLRVPVDRRNPYTSTIDIALARRIATDPAARIGSLIVNPGGPGGSGVDLALAADRFFSPGLLRRFDIVGFDPRGVARSHPVVCSAALTAAAPSPLLDSEAAFRATIDYNRRLAADCRARTGPVFDHVDTLSVVQDLEALRAALGEAQLSYYGISYGTMLGQQYAERYPHRVRAIGLDSVIDHSVGTRDFLTVETDAAQDSFDEFVAWCARDADCVLRGRDVKALWGGLLDRARRGNLRDPIDPRRRLTVLDLIDIAFGSFYEPQWYALAYYLDAAGSAPRQRSRAERASLSAARRQTHPPHRRTSADQVENPFQAIFCADWTLPVRGYRDYRAQLRRLAARAPQMLVSPLALGAVVGCLGWPSRADNPQRRIHGVHTGPLLLMHARHDPATAFRWAQGAARQLGDVAELVPYEGWGHAVYGRSACVTSVADRYLTALFLPPADGRCPAVPPDPFGVERRNVRTRVPGGVPGRW
ncbi:MAG TPA: alpha/beta fold hydrolase [Actinoplanes sp.]|nr:alpha/beta fold hydrolase [Actinoplanes sp.]